MIARYLPHWLQEWVEQIELGIGITAVFLSAMVIRVLARRLLSRLSHAYNLPAVIQLSAKRLINFIISIAAFFAILDIMGVSATVIWTAFTGFAAVGAVAFFAAWSVLSNIFCTVLIFFTRPFRLGDMIEIVENGEKPGFRGRVIDVNMIYSTLEEFGGAHGGGNLVQVPNSLFFQRVLRRWKPGTEPEASEPQAIASPAPSAPASQP